MIACHFTLKHFTALLCLLSIFLGAQASAEVSATQFGTLLNLSGKQRMLTQKMSKEYLFIAKQIDVDKNQKSLQATQALFHKTLVGLESGDADLGLPIYESARASRQLKKVWKLWDEFRPLMEAAIADQAGISDATVAQVAKLNVSLLKNMNKTVLIYEKEAGKGAMAANKALAVAINLAGKQRMLTQRMSKEALLIAYGHDAAGSKLALLDTVSLFDRTLKGLKAGDSTLGLEPVTDQAILDQLTIVNQLWRPFHEKMQGIIDSGATDANTLEFIATHNLPLLKEMNQAVQLFSTQAL